MPRRETRSKPTISVKGWRTSNGNYVQIDPEEIKAIAPEASHAIEIDNFAPREKIDDLYLISPLLHHTQRQDWPRCLAVIRETIEAKDTAALAQVVFPNRESVMALESCGKGLAGMLR